MFVVKLDPLVNTKDPAVPVSVLSNLACKPVIMLKAPLTLEVFVAANANRMLPAPLLKTSDEPASITKSSPTSPDSVRVLVPVVALAKLAAALLTNFICAQVILPLASTATRPVAGVAPPTLLPSKTSTSEAPVDEGLVVPEPFRDVFQLVPVEILVADAVPPTQ